MSPRSAFFGLFQLLAPHRSRIPFKRKQYFCSATAAMATIANTTLTGPASEEDLYAYKAQKWMWNESQQLQRRYVKFDTTELVKVAEAAAGAHSVCTNITKLPEGNFNKAFLARMEGGKELIVKIPNPNSGRKYYTTASEAATMDYVRTKLGLPVPRVLAYCSRTSETKLGAEYVVMEKVPGVELGRVWDSLEPRDKVSLVKQLAEITSKLSNKRFPCYGSLYYQHDLAESEARVIDNVFALGPTTARPWYDDRRDEIDIYRGPWVSASALMDGLVQREIACLNTFSTFPKDCQQGIYNGPGGYRPTHASKLAVIHGFQKISKHILPSRPSLNDGIIWHYDLHSDNIFVDPNNPTQITGIIDWQATPIYPMFLAAHHPSVLDFDGPKLEGFTQPVLPPNIKEMSQKTKQAAKDLFLAQSLWLTYEIQVQRQSPDLLHAFRFADTHQCQLLAAIGPVFDDGEPFVQSLIRDIINDDVWGKIVGTDQNGSPRIACPVQYSEDEVRAQREQFALWEKDIERKQQIITEIGAYTGWNGAVSPDEYNEMSKRLDIAKKRFLDREGKTPEERKAWERVWPFQDDMSEK